MSRMKNIFGLTAMVIVLTVAIATAFGGRVQAQSCGLDICKSAENSSNTEFDIGIQIGELPEVISLLGSGEGSCESIQIPLGQFVDVFELPIPNWSLVDVDCDLTGINFVFFDGGVELECLTPSAFGSCTFINVQGVTATNIPTLSEWGMIAAAAGLGLIGLYFAKRRRGAVSV